MKKPQQPNFMHIYICTFIHLCVYKKIYIYIYIHRRGGCGAGVLATHYICVPGLRQQPRPRSPNCGGSSRRGPEIGHMFFASASCHVVLIAISVSCSGVGVRAGAEAPRRSSRKKKRKEKR